MKRQVTTLIAALAVILVLAQFCTAANLVSNSGFEVFEATCPGWPSIYGDWSGDYSSIVGTSDGIAPLEGSQMLKFRGGAWESWEQKYVACQVPQIIDISSYNSLVTAGLAVASASAYFNRVAGDAQTDTEFFLRIWAHEGAPSTYPAQKGISYLDVVDVSIITDSDLGTWEICQASLALPTNTDFLVIEVIANENVFDDLSGVEFDGHYVDAVSLTIVPEPTSFLLLSMGALMFRRKRKA